MRHLLLLAIFVAISCKNSMMGKKKQKRYRTVSYDKSRVYPPPNVRPLYRQGAIYSSSFMRIPETATIVHSDQLATAGCIGACWRMEYYMYILRRYTYSR